MSNITAVIRHIFAHGCLRANASGIGARDVTSAYMSVSGVLPCFMDAEFTRNIRACYDRIRVRDLTRETQGNCAIFEGAENS